MALASVASAGVVSLARDDAAGLSVVTRAPSFSLDERSMGQFSSFVEWAFEGDEGSQGWYVRMVERMREVLGDDVLRGGESLLRQEAGLLRDGESPMRAEESVLRDADMAMEGAPLQRLSSGMRLGSDSMSVIAGLDSDPIREGLNTRDSSGLDTPSHVAELIRYAIEDREGVHAVLDAFQRYREATGFRESTELSLASADASLQQVLQLLRGDEPPEGDSGEVVGHLVPAPAALALMGLAGGVATLGARRRRA